MIFDKEGKIVTTDAPRPGNDKIVDELNKLVSAPLD